MTTLAAPPTSAADSAPPWVPNRGAADESLDPRSKREVQQFIRDIRADSDVTVLLCTHDLAEAEAMCERVIIFDQGRILAEGAPSDLRARHGDGGASLGGRVPAFDRSQLLERRRVQ